MPAEEGTVPSCTRVRLEACFLIWGWASFGTLRIDPFQNTKGPMPFRNLLWIFLTPPEVLGIAANGNQRAPVAFWPQKTHRLRFWPSRNATPQSATANIIFGQPDPRAVAEAANLKWIHISTSGITRYDNPTFRALVAERKHCGDEQCGRLQRGVRRSRPQLPFGAGQKSSARTQDPDRQWHRRMACLARFLHNAARTKPFSSWAFGRDWPTTGGVAGPIPNACHRLPPERAGAMKGLPVIAPDQLAQALAHEARPHHQYFAGQTWKTRHFFDGHAPFATIKPGAVFYNIGRGTTVDQTALLAVLRSGRLKAAWLDVTEPEPLPDDHPLLDRTQLFCHPRMWAGGHVGEGQKLWSGIFLKNFERYVRGEPLFDRIM